MIPAQYYNLIRLGRTGYTQIPNAMRENARCLAKGVEATGQFDLINDGTFTPCCCCKLKDESRWNGADLVAALAQHGWIILAVSLPPGADGVTGIRMTIKKMVSRDVADKLRLVPGGSHHLSCIGTLRQVTSVGDLLRDHFYGNWGLLWQLDRAAGQSLKDDRLVRALFTRFVQTAERIIRESDEA